MLPRMLKNFNLFIDGVGFIGRCEEVTLPKITHKMEEFQGAGMFAPVEIDMGLEKLEMEVSLKEFSPEILKEIGTADVAGIPLRFVAAAVSDDSENTTDAIEIFTRGRYRELDLGSAKAAEASTMKASVALTYFKYILNGEDIIEIDTVNMIYNVGGVDRLEAQRAALSL